MHLLTFILLEAIINVSFRLVFAHINFWSSFWFTRAPPRGAHRDRVSAPLKKQKQYKNRTPPKKKQNTQETPEKIKNPQKTTQNAARRREGAAAGGAAFCVFFLWFLIFSWCLLCVLFFFGGGSIFVLFLFFLGALTLSLYEAACHAA